MGKQLSEMTDSEREVFWAWASLATFGWSELIRRAYEKRQKSKEMQEALDG